MDLIDKMMVTFAMVSWSSLLLIVFLGKGLGCEFEEIPKIATSLIITVCLSFLGIFICILAEVWF